jgi:hypothetical protein
LNGVLLLVSGALLIALSIWSSRRGGTRTRAARLMAGVAPVSPREALLVGDGHYLAVSGNIDAAEAFEDESHRPLVYRRERVLIADGTTWREVERVVRSVPFVISDGDESVALDAEQLGDGLVVIERQWDGSVAELAAAHREYRDPESATLVAQLASAAPATGARVILEQISTLDRGTAAGLLRGGTLTAGGAGQPLVLTTLDRREALRILGSGQRANLAAGLLTLLLLLAGILLLAIGTATLITQTTTGVRAVPSPTIDSGPDPTVARGESGDARNGGVGTGPGGVAGLIGALAAPFAVGALIAVVVSVAVRARRKATTIQR